MVLRTARTGARAGRQFFGCSRFPACRTTINIEADGPTRPGTAAKRQPRVEWTEAGRRTSWSSFYAPAGGRLRSWDPVASLSKAEGWDRAVSQAAFYRRGTRREVEPVEPVVVDIIRRLLTRGDRPPVDPLVEAWILGGARLGGALLKSKDPGVLAPRLSTAADLPSRSEVVSTILRRDPCRLDATIRQSNGEPIFGSDAEARHLEAVIGRLGQSAGNWTHLQPQLAGLLGDAKDYRRGDFLFAVPGSRPVMLEVDGEQHGDEAEVDRDRDQALNAAGVTVVRAAAGSPDSSAERVAAELEVPPGSQFDLRDALLVWGPACAHRIGRSMIEAVDAGFLGGSEWRIQIEEPLGVGPVAVRAFAELFAAVCDVWASTSAPQSIQLVAGAHQMTFQRSGTCTYSEVEERLDPAAPDVTIAIDLFLGPLHELPGGTGAAVVVRSVYVPLPLRDVRLEGGLAVHVPHPEAIDEAALRRVLAAVFGKREFYPREPEGERRGQEVAIRRLLGGRDTVVLLPTGAGKSLIYQLAGLLLPGRTLVIDPIVALIDDQLAGLAAQGIDRALGITSADRASGEAESKLAEVRAGDALFFFVAPERLQQRAFRDAIRSLTAAAPISVCVADEAHCVSEWGHDFRTSYLDLGRVLRSVCADLIGTPPPILALTGTASRAVLRDMLIELDIDRSDPECIVSPKSFDRQELRFSIVQASEDEVVPRLIGALRSLPARFRVTEREFFDPGGDESYCGIVFSQTVNPSRSMRGGGLLQLSGTISAELGAPVGMYSGTKPKDWRGDSWDAKKRQDAAAFKDNKQTVLVATKAYGMGIDKPNVRYVIHLGVPGSIEGYYQEAGRAGRDRGEAQCVIVHSPSDRGFHDFTHGKSYRGISSDIDVIRRFLELLGDLTERALLSVPRSRDDDAAEDEERAIHRLKILGVVSDYLVDWGGSKFDLKLNPVTPATADDRLLAYVRRTQPGRVRAFELELETEPAVDAPTRVIANARRLIEFIYETVVRSRERALDEMVSLADTATDDRTIRDRILRYLELGRIAGELETLVDEEPFSFNPWQQLYHQLDTLDDAREWRGATARYLESAPDHPGLLVGRALAEAVVPGGDQQLFSRNLGQAMASAVERYAVERGALAPMLEWLLEWLHERRPQWSALGYLVAERAIGPDHLTLFSSLERRIIADASSVVPSELGLVLARRIDRASARLTDLVSAVAELSS